MNFKIKSIISLIILTINNYNYSIVNTYNLYTKGNKQVLILGNIHAQDDSESERIKIDKLHKAVFFEWLSKLEKSQQNINFIIEGSKTDKESFRNSADKYQCLCVELPIYANKNIKSGNVAYTLADCRTDRLRFSLIDQIMRFRQIIYRNNVFDYNFFTKYYKKNYDEIFGLYDLNDFFEELNIIKENLKKLVNDNLYLLNLYAELEKHIKNALTSAKHLNIDLYSNVSEICTDESKFLDFSQWFLKFIDPIDTILPDIGFLTSLVNGLNKFDYIIIYCGQAHVLNVKKYLINQGFVSTLQAGAEETNPFDVDYKNYFKSDHLKKLLESTFNIDKESSEAKTSKSANKTCAVCAKENCTNRCGACKAVYYCSTNCQKEHWTVHKTNCNKNKLGKI